MQNVKSIRRAAVLMMALPLAGCGLFNGSTDKLKPKDPNRTVAKMVANITSTTFFADEDSGKKAVFRGTLYDQDGNQFYGPVVKLDGVEITPGSGAGSSTIYYAEALDFTTGQTFTTTVQDHAATSPPVKPQLFITSPVKHKAMDSSTPPKEVTYSYYKQTAREGVTINWTGGDPTQPVYIFVFGTSDSNLARRLFVSDDPLQSPSDPENFGKPIENTGTYTIPAQLTERYIDADGAIATRTVYTFDDPVTTDNVGRSFNIYVVQKDKTIANPIQFSALSTAYISASVPPKT